MERSILRNKGMGFVLLVVLTLLTNQIALSQLVCQLQSTETINGAIDANDPTQNTRVFRGGTPSSCTGRTSAGGNPTTGTFRFDSFTRTNNTGRNACVSVQVTTSCTTTANPIFLTAYSSYDPANPNNNIIGIIGASPNGTTTSPATFSFPVAAGASYTIVVNEVTANAGCSAYSLEVTTRVGCRQAGYDKSNDGKAELVFWRPSSGNWITLDTVTGQSSTTQFGLNGDIPVPGDYTGDGATDVAVFRPNNNFWYYGTSQTTPNVNFVGRALGTAGDVPVPGDYDKDGKTDLAVWRQSDGFWYALRSSDNTLFSRQWGQNGDTPVVGDFDGDLANDLGIVRTIDGVRHWFILQSNFNYTRTAPNTLSLTGFVRYGLPTDKLVPGDYDGDGITDVAVWRPSDGTWYYRASGNIFNSFAFQFGQNGDIPQPADYDGDRKTDFAVVRSSGTNRFWYLNNSSTNTPAAYSFGATNDQPVTAPYRVE
jgi:hypothetical protein